MWRKAFPTLVTLSLALLLGIPGAWAATAPGPVFGFFNGLSSGGNAGNGVEAVNGWALADTGVFAVDIFVDGAIIGRANYGRSRPLATQEYPNFPDSAAPGFGYQLDTTKFLNGLHVLTARVESRSGEVKYLNLVRLYFNNVEADLLPFGKIEFPNTGAQLYGNCNLTASLTNPPTPIYNIVTGYALSVDATSQQTGIGYVELLIDGAIAYNSKTDCGYLAAAGGYAECYGIYRPDLQQLFPGLKDAPNAGFRFVLDVGDLLSPHHLGNEIAPPLYVPGSHQLNIRSGDVVGNVTDIASIAVTFTCKDFTNEDLAIGNIDNPVPGLLEGGQVITSGWALDFEGVNAVLVYVDGNLYNFAFYGLSRPDILAEYPSYPSAGTSGWYSYIDTTQLSNGVHQVSVQVVDDNGVYTFIGKSPMTVANPIP